MREESWKQIQQELQLRYSRSSGPGGQHVNRTESRVEVIWAPADSRGLSEPEKALLLERLGAKLTQQGEILIACGEFRSRTQNVESALARLKELIAFALRPVKKRRPTRVPKSVARQRVDRKKRRSEVKKNRGKVRY